ncbi:hypothetical protein E1258_10395 [Micromonospora sp. KC207]|uniref:hypothetical protein n=1 Tax=Micromonospora sp. KC207 TaxID=2530377 RepID=UPI001050081F|nr:hypothetical protein [Micromonospora sp. KC207]TDC63519.1 hypothetical protein E1258_10395 [Micromonospora sp. KC207]
MPGATPDVLARENGLTLIELAPGFVSSHPAVTSAGIGPPLAHTRARMEESVGGELHLPAGEVRVVRSDAVS